MKNKKIKVLTIGGNKKKLVMLQALIEGAFPSVEVITTPNGQEGLALAAREEPDAILLDITLPDIGGFAMCASLKANKRLCDIPVVFLIGKKDGKEHRIKALECGADALLSKPFDESELTLQLRAMFKIRSANVQRCGEKIKEIEKKYRQIALNMSDVVWTTDLSLNATYVSPSVEKMLGETTKTHMARSIEEKFTPDSLKKIRSILFEELKKEEDPAVDKSRSRIVEAQHYKADKSVIWVSMHISFLRDETGKPIGFLGVNRDITERKKTEAQLMQNFEEQKRAAQSLLASETRYRRLFESAKDGILILDAKTGQIEDVNPFLINLLGYTKEQFVNKFVWEIGALKDQIPNYEKFLDLQKNDYIRYEDMPLQTAKGKLIHVEFVSNVYTVNDSEVIQCNIRDMTDRKNMAAALLESERKYTEYINNAPDAVFVIDENGRYIDINPAATKITGYSREELLAMSIKDISAKKSLHDALKHFKKLSETGTSTGELQYLHKNGETRWWNIDAVKLSAHRFLGFSSDITDKKKSGSKPYLLRVSRFSHRPYQPQIL